MDTHPATRWTQFITPLGGIIALTCFFFPWVERGAPFVPTIEKDGSLTYSISGVDFFLTKFLAPNASLIAVAFIASAVIISLSLYMVIRRTPWKSRVPILISAGIGLSHLLTEYLWRVRVSQLPGVSSYSAQVGFWGDNYRVCRHCHWCFFNQVGRCERSRRSFCRSKTTVVYHTRWRNACTCLCLHALGRN